MVPTEQGSRAASAGRCGWCGELCAVSASCASTTCSWAGPEPPWGAPRKPPASPRLRHTSSSGVHAVAPVLSAPWWPREVLCLTRGHPAAGRQSRLCCRPLELPPPLPSPPRPVPRKRLPAQSENSVGSMNSAHPLQIAPPSLSGRQGPPEAHGGHREQLSTYWNRSSWVEAALRGLEPGHSPASGLSFAISKVGW